MQPCSAQKFTNSSARNPPVLAIAKGWLAAHRPFTDAPACMEWMLTVIFAIDVLLTFRVAFKIDGTLVVDRSMIAAEYFRCDSSSACD